MFKLLTSLALLASACGAGTRTCYAQTAEHSPTPKLLIFVDTAGVAPVAEDVYLTWVYAKASPGALPSSGVLVAFDCGRHMVRRIAHVVYALAPGDSTKVTGQIIEDNLPWQTVSVPDVFSLVCQVGRQHVAEGMRSYVEPTRPEPSKPASPWSQV